MFVGGWKLPPMLKVDNIIPLWKRIRSQAYSGGNKKWLRLQRSRARLRGGVLLFAEREWWKKKETSSKKWLRLQISRFSITEKRIFVRRKVLDNESPTSAKLGNSLVQLRRVESVRLTMLILCEVHWKIWN